MNGCQRIACFCQSKWVWAFGNLFKPKLFVNCREARSISRQSLMSEVSWYWWSHVLQREHWCCTMYDNEVKFVATFFSLPHWIGSRIYNLRLFSQWSVVYFYPTNHDTIGVRAPPKDNDNVLSLIFGATYLYIIYGGCYASFCCLIFQKFSTRQRYCYGIRIIFIRLAPPPPLILAQLRYGRA